MQLVLQLISQRIYFENSSCMVRDVTTVQRFLQLVSQSFLMLSTTGNYFQMASFYWLLNKNIARQVARGMLHCAMAKKCVAALRQSLRKVEPDSTSCNASCNKNVA